MRASATIRLLATAHVTILSPFVFPGGSVEAPMEMPPIAVSSTALSLVDDSIPLKHMFRSSQPFFLLMLCGGNFLMAACIIPMSLQVPIPQAGLWCCMHVYSMLVVCAGILNCKFALSLQVASYQSFISTLQKYEKEECHSPGCHLPIRACFCTQRPSSDSITVSSTWWLTL